MESLRDLLKNMSPRLNPGRYVYVNLGHKEWKGECLLQFREKEGLTIIMEKGQAEKNTLEFDYECAWITLEINSPLQSVGLTAAFSNALAENSISCNVVAAYHHDHIFVDFNDGERALKVLENLASQY